MTEPKHIPLTARLAEYAEHWAEEFIEAMTKADDAHVPLDDDVPPPLPTDAELAAEYDRVRGYDRPLEEQAADAREDIEAARRLYCNGICITAGELGLPYGGVAYAHPDCELHGGTE